MNKAILHINQLRPQEAMQIAVPCVLMRGGTSKGPFFLASDLPADAAERDAMLVELMGAGHDLQVDGIGGGHPQTSKVAIISASRRPGIDIDYLFAQVHVQTRSVDVSPNCGNMLAAVGPFAIEEGLIPASDGETCVRIFNVNTGKTILSCVQTPNHRVRYDGDTRIDGVPGTAAPIGLTFMDAAGAKTGRLLPTGAPRDTIDGVSVSCIDMATPMVLMAAADLGRSGHESAAVLNADQDLLARLQRIRIEAGRKMGLGDVTHAVLPKPVLLAPAAKGGTLAARYFMPHSCHTSLATTGAVGIATACVIADSVAHVLAPRLAPAVITVEHPAGQLEVSLRPDAEGRLQASLIRTARRLFEGTVLVSRPSV